MSVFINGIGNISAQPTFGLREFQHEYNIAPVESRLVMEPDYKTYIEPRLLRRMSKILKMGVAAAREAMRDAKIAEPEAIVTATALGCTQDTHRFLKELIERDEAALAPTSFIQSTHNTIGGQIALQLGLHGYNMTYTQRGSSFESALLDGLLLINNREATNAMVGGVDELIAPVEQLQRRLGFYRHEPSSPDTLSNANLRGSIGGEGSTFFMLSGESDNAYAQVLDVKSVHRPTRNQLQHELKQMLERHGLSIREIDLVVTGRNGDESGDQHYDHFIHQLNDSASEAVFKPFCGEYQSASGFAVWLAAMALYQSTVPAHFLRGHAPKKIEKVLIYNHFQQRDHNLILLSK